MKRTTALTVATLLLWLLLLYFLTPWLQQIKAQRFLVFPLYLETLICILTGLILSLPKLLVRGRRRFNLPYLLLELLLLAGLLLPYLPQLPSLLPGGGYPPAYFSTLLAVCLGFFLVDCWKTAAR